MLEACKIGLKGFTTYNDNEELLIEVEGQTNKLNEFINWCKIGAPGSEIKAIEIKNGDMKNFKSFEMINPKNITSMKKKHSFSKSLFQKINLFLF